MLRRALKHDAPAAIPSTPYTFTRSIAACSALPMKPCRSIPPCKIRVAIIADRARAHHPAIRIRRPGCAVSVQSRPAGATSDAPRVIDEAYFISSAETAIPLAPPTRIFCSFKPFRSRGPLAGLRVGYAIGDADLNRGTDPVKDSSTHIRLAGRPQAAPSPRVRDEAGFRRAGRA